MFIYIILLSLNLGMFLILLILLEWRCRGISDLSRHRLKYQFGKNLQRRPTSAEYELHKNLRVGWDYQLHKPLLSIMCQQMICQCLPQGQTTADMTTLQHDITG